MTRHVRDDLKGGLDGSYTERGPDLGRCISWKPMMGADITCDINSAFTARVRYAWGDIRNFCLTTGKNRQDNLLMMQMNYDF